MGAAERQDREDERGQQAVSDIRAAVASRSTILREIVNFRKDGTLFWNRLSITPIFDEGETLLYFIGIQEDITESREKERLQQKIAEQLLINRTTRTAEEKQKKEIGEELHDNVNQLLATLKLYIGLGLKKQKDPGEMLQKSEEMVNMAMEEIRKLSRSLIGPDVLQEPLQEAVKRLVSAMQVGVPFRITLQAPENLDDCLSPQVQLNLYRIVQEQLTNIVKYANPRQVVIALHKDEELVHLSIKDDGAGFDPFQTAGGIGLRNMEHRATAENGHFFIHTAPGRGCEIKVSLPCTQAC